MRSSRAARLATAVTAMEATVMEVTATEVTVTEAIDTTVAAIVTIPMVVHMVLTADMVAMELTQAVLPTAQRLLVLTAQLTLPTTPLSTLSTMAAQTLMLPMAVMLTMSLCISSTMVLKLKLRHLALLASLDNQRHHPLRPQVKRLPRLLHPARRHPLLHLLDLHLELEVAMVRSLLHPDFNMYSSSARSQPYLQSETEEKKS
jgi:hypothetical protein